MKRLWIVTSCLAGIGFNSPAFSVPNHEITITELQQQLEQTNAALAVEQSNNAALNWRLTQMEQQINSMAQLLTLKSTEPKLLLPKLPQPIKVIPKQKANLATKQNPDAHNYIWSVLALLLGIVSVVAMAMPRGWLRRLWLIEPKAAKRTKSAATIAVKS